MRYFRKYLLVLKLSWQNGLVYRTSLLMWRLRQFLSSLMSLTIWQVMFTSNQTLFNYQEKEMISYIFLVSFLQSMILATIMHGLAADIYSGKISDILLKPINLFAYLATLDLSDKLKNIFFASIEAIILAFIFHPVIVLPSLTNLVIFIFTILIGVILYFLVQLLFGSIGFWSPETWAPRFLFMMFLEFTAGKLFPLDILPQFVQKIIFLTPFPYFSYFQIQVFLNRLTTTQLLTYLLTSILWIILLTVIVSKLWQRGIKEYQAAGI